MKCRINPDLRTSSRQATQDLIGTEDLVGVKEIIIRELMKAKRER